MRSSPGRFAVRRALTSTVASNVLLALVAVASLGLTAKVLFVPVKAPVSAITRSEGPVRAAFVGGWLTAGGDAGIAARTAAQLGWQAIVRDHPGAGLLRGGRDGSGPLALQAVYDVQGRYDEVVVIAAGSSDLATAPDRLEVAAAHLIDRLRASLPRSTALVLIAPNETAGAAARAALARVAAQRLVHFFDPSPAPGPGGDTATARISRPSLVDFLRNLGIRRA
jgi:hypothetical protein